MSLPKCKWCGREFRGEGEYCKRHKQAEPAAPTHECPHCHNTTWLRKMFGWICSKCRYFTDK